jgi:hypothetical protein
MDRELETHLAFLESACAEVYKYRMILWDILVKRGCGHQNIKKSVAKNEGLLLF